MSHEYLQPMISFFESLAHTMPLELYVLLGSFVEEIIAPIPQSLIVVLGGSMAKAQSYPLISILGLAFLSALGKTLAGWILYILGDKAEHIVVGKCGRLLGISEKDIAKWSVYLNKGKRDVIALLLARIIPIVPTAPVSVVCGVMKIDIKNFLLLSLIGLTLRNAPFFYLGYVGVSSYEALTSHEGTAESVIKIIVFLLFLGFFCWIGYKMTKRRLRAMEHEKKK
jgi:membrane protein DedA with SNARE-associated domain